MSDRSRRRLLVLQVLVLSLLATLLGRLWFMQVVSGEEYAQAAADNGVRAVVTPAVRGVILDAQGRPLVQNRTALVVSVDRSTLLDLPEDGEPVVRRLATLLDLRYRELDRRLTLCGTPNAAKPPVCWNGSPYQPIPVAKDVAPKVALQIMERQEDYPGVTAELQAVRDYPQPFAARTAHLLGYLGPVTAEELAERQSRVGEGGARFTRTDLVGRGGLEQVYDRFLRGRPGLTELAVDRAGKVIGTISEDEARAGNYLVTSIDAQVQRVVEDELKAAIARARAQTDRGGTPYRARSGAAVVMDVQTGRIVAMASYPDYDPSVWVGGISQQKYQRLTSEKAYTPLVNRAIQGQYAPASTFKIVTTAAAAAAGYSLYGSYPCPGSLTIAGGTFPNYESGAYGNISLARALEVSCNTVFYKLAYEMWLREGGYDLKSGATQYLSETAQGFGYGSPTGIDLPGEAAGRVTDRQWRREYYLANKDYYCNFDERASEADRNSSYLKRFAAEFCVDGDQFRAGDAVLAAIGQGDMLATPLQVTQAYAAIANGGTIHEPQLARAVVAPGGRLVKEFAPKTTGKLPASPEVISYLQRALAGVTVRGTASYPFSGFPLDEVPVAAKTGTGEVQGSQTTSWFASYAPAKKPRFAIVMMVPEGGTGSMTSGESVRAIYEALLGVKGGTVDPRRAILPRGRPVADLPTIRPDGRIVPPEETGLGRAARRGASG